MSKLGDKFASEIAREYIEEHIGKISEEEIINNLRRKTNLKMNTIDMLYKEVLTESYEAARLERKEKEKQVLGLRIGEGFYKGRKRELIRIDDSRLYKKIEECS